MMYKIALFFLLFPLFCYGVSNTSSGDEKEQLTLFWQEKIDAFNKPVPKTIEDLIDGVWEMEDDMGTHKAITTLTFHYAPYSLEEKKRKNSIERLSRGTPPVMDQIYGLMTETIIASKNFPASIDLALPREFHYFFTGNVIGEELFVEIRGQEADFYKNITTFISGFEMNLKNFKAEEGLSLNWQVHKPIGPRDLCRPHKVLFKKRLKTL